MTNDDTMLFAVHEEFLWIMDLSQPDKWILPILAGIATFIAFSMNQQQQEEATGTAAQMNGMMKMMKYIFPIMIEMCIRDSFLCVQLFPINLIAQLIYDLRGRRIGFYLRGNFLISMKGCRMILSLIHI